jgi:hypothetical protein
MPGYPDAGYPAAALSRYPRGKPDWTDARMPYRGRHHTSHAPGGQGSLLNAIAAVVVIAAVIVFIILLTALCQSRATR